MRTILAILLASFFCSCNIFEGEVFFDYDEIIHYKTYTDEKDLFENKNKTELDSLKERVIMWGVPKSIRDTFFLSQLENIGYNKTIVPKAKFEEIDQIFREKQARNGTSFACIHYYRDILIFKKKSKTIGMAKICFSCMDNQIFGTTKNTKDFGQDGDYGRLKEILEKK